MTLEQEGAYLRLLAAQWLDGSIPASVPALARMCKSTAKAMQRLWDGWTEEKTMDVVPGLSECFVGAPGQAGRLINERLEHERAEQKARRKERADSGKRGAKARWVNGSAIAQPLKTDSTGPAVTSEEPLANDGLSFSLSSSSAFAEDTPQSSQPKPEDGDNAALRCFDRVREIYPSHRFREGTATRAFFDEIRSGRIRPDEAPPVIARSVTFTEFVELVKGWAASEEFRKGFSPAFVNFIADRQYLDTPTPSIEVVAPGTTDEHLAKARQLDREMMGLTS
jgi:uncharacterized protein YdaU (DUF1376 family)